MPQHTDDQLRRILGSTRVIAVVGVSANPDRPSHGVARYLISEGFRVIPVNPGLAGQTLFDETVYADLASVPADVPVDMIDIFRRPEAVPAIVDAAIAHLPSLRTVWMQLGVSHAEAAKRAEAAGLQVVQNRCTKIELARLAPARGGGETLA
jgi:uncharacterized protein